MTEDADDRLASSVCCFVFFLVLSVSSVKAQNVIKERTIHGFVFLS